MQPIVRDNFEKIQGLNRAFLGLENRLRDWSIDTCHYWGRELVSYPHLCDWGGLCTHYIGNLLPHGTGNMVMFHTWFRQVCLAALGGRQCLAYVYRSKVEILMYMNRTPSIRTYSSNIHVPALLGLSLSIAVSTWFDSAACKSVATYTYRSAILCMYKQHNSYY